MTKQQLDDVWTFGQQSTQVNSAAILDSEGFTIGFVIGTGIDPKKSAEDLAWRIVADHNLNLMAMAAPSFEESANFDPQKIATAEQLRLIKESLAPDVEALVEALEAIERMDFDDHSLTNAVLVARNALTAHRKGGDV